MKLTWRQLIAYKVLSDTLDGAENASTLWITALGAQGEEKSIRRTMKELADGS